MTTIKKSILTLACLMAATAANAAAGHIYDIRPYYDNKVQTGPLWSAANPMVGGQIVRFTLRVACEATHTGDEDYKWYAEYTGHGSAAEAWVSSPMTIGIFVSGKPVEATLVKAIESDTGSDYTDLVFEYLVKPGDFALPIVLANADGEPMSQPSGESNLYYIQKNHWSIRNAKGDEANLWFGTWMVRPAGAEAGVSDYYLREAGFYVKTVDFDSDWQEPKTKSNPGVWRSVHEGSTDTLTVDPTLALVSPATNAVTLHVWSDNPSAVVVTNANEDLWYDVVMKLDKDGTQLATNRVLDISIEYGQTSVPFEIFGVKSNETANLVLSASTNYTYNPTTYERYTDYITVPVACVEKKVKVQSVTGAVDGGLEEVSVGTNYTKRVGTYTVTVTTGYTNDLVVTVTPRLRDGTGAWSNYIHVAETDSAGMWGTLTPCTFTIPKGEIGNELVDTVTKTISLYAMGADYHTADADKGIEFDISYDEAASNFFGAAKSASKLWFKPTNPLITSPYEGQVFKAAGKKDKSFEIKVADSYKNICDTNSGYQVWYKQDETADSYTELTGTGTWALDTYGVLRDKGGTGSLPAIKYVSAGTYATEFYVLAPDGVSKSEVRKISVEVSAPAKMWMSTELAQKRGNEGTNVTVTVTLSRTADAETEGESCYAFIRPLNAVSSNSVECSFLAADDNIGLEIMPGEKETYETATMTFLDGTAKGLTLKYDVVLLKNQVWDDDSNEVIDSFQSQVYTPTILNVKPYVTQAAMQGVTAKSSATYTVDESGGTMDKTVSIGVTNKFSFSVYEPGTIDLSTTNAGELFELKCSIQEEGGGGTVELYGDPANTNFSYAFAAAGTAKFIVQVRDKDMGSNEWSDKFVFYVNVTDQPYVTLTSDSGDFSFSEKSVGKAKTGMKVALSENSASFPIDVEVSVTSLAAGMDNLGMLKLAGDCKTNEFGNYIVTFPARSKAAKTLYVDESDGTRMSMDKGFLLKARVITHEKNNDDIYVDELYLASENYAFIQNNPPSITTSLGSENVESNAFIVALGESKEISWSVDDIAADLGWYDENGKYNAKTNIQVVWTSPNNTVTTNVCDSTNTYYFTAKFENPGVQVVTVEVNDKDKDSGFGTTRKQWYYKVQSAKMLSVYAVGPGKGTSTIADRYASLAGCGEGHVWVKDATFSAMEYFIQDWNCRLSGNATIYGWGYKTNDRTDNGDLNDKHDYACDPSGKYTKSAPFYTYGGDRDSFLYLWVKYGSSETTSSSGDTTAADTATIAKIAMETWDGTGTTTPSPYSPSLPTESDENGAYAKTFVEAVFSKEYLASDNMGDINQDGLPDLYVKTFKLGVFDPTSGELTGDDTKDISGYNLDLDENDAEKPDFLPGKANTLLTYFIPEITNTTDGAAYGTPFTAVQELRGAYTDSEKWSALNDACSSPYVGIKGVTPDRVYEDPATSPTSTLTQVEWAGFRHWCELNGKSVTDKAVWQAWSPERPTSPILRDSDKDGLSDACEYYYWYRAHVGYFEGTNHVFLTGRRFVPARPCEPVEISNEEIEAVFDPAQYADHDVDTDNDGLTDFEEAALGTNPFDYDTDNDGLPDGFEVVCSMTDARKYATNEADCDADLNFDGDAMACCEFSGDDAWYVVALTNGLTVCSPTAFTFAEGAEPGVTNIETAAGGCYAAWRYGADAKTGAAVYCRGRQYLLAGTYTNAAVVSVSRETVRVLHFHVYQQYGFDPRTGWNVPPYFPGHLVNTVPFTVADEFKLQAFFLYAGGLAAADIEPTKTRPLTTLWLEQTTSPVLEKTGTSGESEVTVYGADTDGDGMPDGWELYLMAGPLVIPDPIPATYDTDLIALTGPYDYYSPLQDYAKVVGTAAQNVNKSDTQSVAGDSLLWTDEYSGAESCAVYSNVCATISNTRPEWKNKWWPTDPWNKDTDGDGLSDSEEGSAFVYGNNEHAANNYEDCVAGGGLNPLSWDTDRDGLPDPWEKEFGGTAKTEADTTTTSVTSDGTTNTTVTAGASVWNDDGMDGTTDDCQKDYDHDGLSNWQEYLVGAMRCWRYDDTVSPWTSHQTAMPDESGKLTVTADDLYARLVQLAGKDYNPGFCNQHFDFGAYFSCAKNDFEVGKDFCVNAQTGYRRTKTVYGHFYMFKDGIYHDLSTDFSYTMAGDNRYTKNGGSGFSYDTHDATTGKGAYPRTYICCSPILSDTDTDGLDDYYEVYHGLNPLLGADREIKGNANPPRDIVFEAYYDPERVPAPWSALQNYWLDLAGVKNLTRGDRPLAVKGATDSLYDFFQFPWLAGLAAADPDGDNIRNQQEAILPNVQAAATYLHTDPTPLWMTDTSYEDSLTYRYYQMCDPSWSQSRRVRMLVYAGDTFKVGETEYSLFDYPWLTPVYDGPAIVAWLVEYDSALNYWNVSHDLFDYEENEGFDSDHDYLGDFEEAQGKTKSASDPQYHDDPLRRQAMWFGGDADRGFLQTSLSTTEQVPTDSSAAEARQNFLYFTVECWAKADPATVAREELQTLVERAIWTGAAGSADEKYLRKNFLIGIKGGKWYAMFDSTGTDKLQPEEITTGPVATTNWTHVAATYDGSYLRLYVDGVCKVEKKTSIQPEHGQMAVTVNAAGEIADSGRLNWHDTSLARSMISVLVGASAVTRGGIAFDYQWKTRDVSKVTAANPLGLSGDVTTMDRDYGNFFRGYIDEVRLWDGARTTDAILADVTARTRYTSTLARQNRDEVYAAWSKGARRDPSASSELPPQLMYHWSFDHVAGAVTEADVVTSPAGFATDKAKTDAMAIWSRPEGWTNCWLTSISETLASRVYSNRAWVPWINDTVGHLPRFDQTTLDSVYWSGNFAGATTAAESGSGYSSFGFPRSAELPSSSRQMLYDIAVVAEDNPYSCNTRWEIVKDDEALRLAYVFAHRNRETEGFDLLPFGGAFARRISAAEGGMWDDGTPADAWAQTGADSNHDGLPDWWWDYADQNYRIGDPGAELGWNTIVSYNGIRMAAYQAFLRDLAKGMLSDCEYHKEYEDTRDLDCDGMPDWWEGLYGIDSGSKADALADPDHDGLSNLQEYKISERDELYLLNPTLANSIPDFDQVDYFLVITNGTHAGKYLGEAYADHDFMEDPSEDEADLDRTRYDAWSDPDEDGWAAFSEMRYSNFKMGIAQKFLSHLVGDEEVRDFPIPVIHATLRYNGDKVASVSNATIVVQAYSGNNLQKEANAVYSITPGASETRTQILGAYSTQTFHGTLTPGNVIAGEDKVSLEFLFVQPDDIFSWTIGTNDTRTFTGTYDEMYAAYTNYRDEFRLASTDLTWAYLSPGGILGYTSSADQALQVSLDKNTQKGRFLLLGKEAGTIDFTTGDFTLNLSSIQDINVEGSEVNMAQCFFRLVYSSKIPTLQSQALSVSLAAPDTGKLTEGTTAFSAYFDLAGDGYTPGTDPIGFVKDVEIGWDQVPELVIEMTDASQAAGARFATPATNATLRIVRTGVNGSADGVTPRIVYSTTLTESSRGYVYEADHVLSGKYGLDWENLRADLQAMEGLKLKDVTSVDYTVTLGDGTIQNIDSNDVVTTFSVEYGAEAVKPSCHSPSEKVDGIVETQRPTFRWTAADDYTAFRLQVRDETAKTTLYESPVAELPARDASGRYCWTAPLYIGTNVLGRTVDRWVLDNNRTYKWRVAMYNAKFSATEEGASAWSDWATMKTQLAEVNDFETLYGTVKVAVRYFGPATNALGDVIVQLYRTADLSGSPAAQTRLFDVAGGVTNLASAARTVAFHGLADGDYYACAFIDRNGDGERQRYETWGYAAQVGLGLAEIWRPVAVTADAGSSKIPSVTVYMEDTDVNGNDVLDWQDDETILKDATSTSTSSTADIDSDGDGLTDYEEMYKSCTKASKWDSDGDGMPDGWEYSFAGTDPLTQDADKVTAGDWMAYYEVTRTAIKTRSTETGAEATYLVPEGETAPSVGANVNGLSFDVAYDYNGVYGIGRRTTVLDYELYQLATVSNTQNGAKGDFLFAADLALGVGTNVNEETAWLVVGAQEPYSLGEKTNFVATALSETNLVVAVVNPKAKVSLGENRVIEVEESATVALVHAQVYDYQQANGLGYGQKTAVSADDAYTKAFTAIDKYLLVRYFEAIGLGGITEDRVNREKLWSSWSLKPGVIDGDWGDNMYGDGIADGWELYVMFGHPAGVASATNAVYANATPSATKINPWKFDDARTVSPGDEELEESVRCTVLAEYGGGNPTNPWEVDTDKDSVLDCYYHLYHLDDPTGDPDGDGLSNYSEYLITEVFGFAKCDPDTYATKDLSTGTVVCDYYKKVGELYLGEMFQDHDRVADAWERTYPAVASASAYDPARDDDGDGWSNWAEAQAGTNPSLVYSPSVDTMLPEYPIPTIRAKVNYAGTLVGAMNFRAYGEAEDAELLKTPSAAWSSTTASSNTVKYLGRNPGKTMTYNIGSGLITPGSLQVYFRDVRCEKTVLYNGEEVASVVSTDTPKWFYFIADDSVGTLWTVASTNSASANLTTPFEIGTVDYTTGAVTIDYSKLPAAYYDRWDNGEGSSEGKSQGVSYNAIKVNLANSFVRIEWTPAAYPTTGNETYYLNDSIAASATCNGHIREGRNTFLVWCDKDGGTDGVYDPGEPFGVVRGVDVGWQGASFEVTLSETSGITPRVDLWTSETSDRSATWSEATFPQLTDRLATEDEFESLTNRLHRESATGTKARIRIVRGGVNDMFAYTLGVGYDVANVVERVYDQNCRSYLCEADFLTDDELDIEWSTLYNEVCCNEGVMAAFPDGVTNMTYFAVLDSSTGFETWFRGASDTNTTITCLKTAIERRFEQTKHAPVAEPMSGIFYSARPTFAWSLPNEEAYAKKYGTSYTAFRLYIFDAGGGTEIYRSKVMRAPAQDAKGVFRWTADVSAGDLVAAGKVLAKTGNYTWRVSMFNAKFLPDDEYLKGEKPSDPVAFSLSVAGQHEMNDAGYSSIDAAVKYAGPSAVLANCQKLTTLKGKVRVQAFTTADFAGLPVAETVVTDAVATVTSPAANARLSGLPATGTYYLRAYIDSDGDRALDDWESWGAAAEPVVLTTSTVTAPVVGIWIEDSDTDGDWLPDAYEYVKNGGSLSAQNANVKSDNATIFDSDQFNVATNRLAGISTYLEGATLTIFQNGSWAKSLLGWGDEKGDISFYDITEAVQKELSVKESTFRVTSMTLVGKTLTLKIDADVSAATIGSELLTKVYTIEKTKTVKVRILKKATLAQKDWDPVGDDLEITFGAGEQTATVLIDEDLKSAFYKVMIVD